MTRALFVVLWLGLGCEEPTASSETATTAATSTTSTTTATESSTWRVAFEARDEGEVRVLSDVIALGTRGLSLTGEEVALPEGALARRGDGAWLVATPDGLAVAANDRPSVRPNDVRTASASVVRARYAEVDGRSLLLTIEERIDGGRVTSLGLRDGASLAELASFLIASNPDGRGQADVRLEGRELVVAVP